MNEQQRKEAELHWLLTLGLSEQAFIVNGQSDVKLHPSSFSTRVYCYNIRGRYIGAIGWEEGLSLMT